MHKDPTIRIRESFLEHGIDCDIIDGKYSSEVVISYPIQQGPETVIRFKSITDNTVSIKIYGLMHRVPGGRQYQLLHAINAANTLLTYLTFFYDEDSLNAKYKLTVVDDDVGEVCFDLISDIEAELDLGYSVISGILHDPPIKRQRELVEILRILQAFREHPIPLPDTDDT